MEKDAQAEREQHDQEKAEENRRRQIRQGHVSEDSGSSEGDEEAKSAKPKAESKKKPE